MHRDFTWSENDANLCGKLACVGVQVAQTMLCVDACDTAPLDWNKDATHPVGAKPRAASSRKIYPDTTRSCGGYGLRVS